MQPILNSPMVISLKSKKLINLKKNLIFVNKLTNDTTSIKLYHNYFIIFHKTPFGQGYVVNCPRQGCLCLLGHSMAFVQETYHINTSNYDTLL